jgi:hypothetical protein
MTIRELKQSLTDLPDESEVVVPKYNSGYGGLFPIFEVESRRAETRGECPGYEEDDTGKGVLVVVLR